VSLIVAGKDFKDINVNEKIRVREVRLIDENGEQLGIVPTVDALRMAKERELDLVEVAGKSSPPVCKIMDYGKYKYQLAKKSPGGKEETDGDPDQGNEARAQDRGTRL